jgi:hypothetical protein
MEIKIKYNGEYPNLCSGDLIVTIDGKDWQFPNGCLISGGSVSFDNNWNEYVSYGEWSINEYPKDFPIALQETVKSAINAQIEHGCCGGCI